jgi:hypothetical protein
MKDHLDAGGGRRLCWLCFVGGLRNQLDSESRCHAHGLVLDRLIAIVQVDTRLLMAREQRRIAKDGQRTKRPKQIVARAAGKKKSITR